MGSWNTTPVIEAGIVKPVILISISEQKESAKKKGESMRKLSLTIFVLSLLAVPAAAADTMSAKSKPTANKTAKLAVAGPTKKAETVRKLEPAKQSEPSAIEVELQKVKELLLQQAREMETHRALLRQQQERMEQMERRLQEQAAANGHSSAQEQEPQNAAPSRDLKILEGQLEAVADTTNTLNQKVTRVEKDVADNKKSADGKLRALGNFSFSGDIRLRGETFHGGTLTTPRNRERFRLRFNVNAKLTDEYFGGLTLASNDATDPISTNQSFTNFYTRKFFSIDKAFFGYKPKWFNKVGGGELELIGGKWAYPWYRTEMTWDNDLNPEGFSESVSWKIPTSFLERISLIGFQTYIAESGSGPDSVMNGGQFQAYWKLGPRIRFTSYAGFYDFLRADAIRAAQSNATVRISGGPCGSSASPLCSGSVPNSAALTGSANSNAANSTQFASKFGILDVIGRFDIRTNSSRWPVMLQFNYANNTRACTNRTAAGAPIATTGPACDPKARDAYWAEVQLGQTRERGDWQFGYTFMRIEREAVLAAFNFSDLRAPTNIATSRVNLGYQLYRNLTFNWTGLFGRQLVTAGSPTKENILRRMQFDLSYKF